MERRFRCAGVCFLDIAYRVRRRLARCGTREASKSSHKRDLEPITCFVIFGNGRDRLPAPSFVLIRSSVFLSDQPTESISCPASETPSAAALAARLDA